MALDESEGCPFGLVQNRLAAQTAIGIAQDARSWRVAGSFDLIESIHRFHDYDSRDTWRVYNSRIGEAALVSRAVGLGILPASRVPASLLSRLHPEVWIEQDENEAPD